MIDGNWQIIAVEYAGEPLPDRTGHLQIIAPRFALQIGGAPREVGRVEFDPTASPATLDLIWRDSAGAETRRLRAILRLRGELLQFCYFPEDSGARPTQFHSSATPATPPAILIRCRKT